MPDSLALPAANTVVDRVRLDRPERPTVEHRMLGAAITQWRFIDGPDTDGVFAGYLSVFGVTDSYGTRMMPGCWRAGGLDEGAIFPLLDMHNSYSVHSVLGGFRGREDDRGLFIEGRFAGTDPGQQARALARMGFAPDLSVGFIRHASLPDDENALSNCELVEGSLIIRGMSSTPGATMTAVRSGPRPADLDAEIRRVLAEVMAEMRAAEVAAQLRRRRAALRLRLLASR